jgi:hypothetical protein
MKQMNGYCTAHYAIENDCLSLPVNANGVLTHATSNLDVVVVVAAESLSFSRIVVL